MYLWQMPPTRIAAMCTPYPIMRHASRLTPHPSYPTPHTLSAPPVCRRKTAQHMHLTQYKYSPSPSPSSLLFSFLYLLCGFASLPFFLEREDLRRLRPLAIAPGYMELDYIRGDPEAPERPGHKCNPAGPY